MPEETSVIEGEDLDGKNKMKKTYMRCDYRHVRDRGHRRDMQHTIYIT